jgi:trehalose synthase
MADIGENAAIVNALQRHAVVVVQKSLAEGFGLTVAEAMWKERPVVASAIGGIQDQIVDGESGILLPHPRDLEQFGAAVIALLEDPARAQQLGARARARIREHFLGPYHLGRQLDLIQRVIARRAVGPPARLPAAARTVHASTA